MKDMQKDTKRTAWMNWMMRLHRSPLLRLELSAVLTILILVICQTVSAAAEQRSLSEKMIRLHVIANSDSEDDQTMKLLARDAVLTRAEAILRQASNREEAMEDLNAALPELERTAYDACGGAYPVHAVLEMTEFPRKEYDGFALPAGEYMALRVIIGEGAGRNWWCVVYPPLCMASCTELEDTALRAGLDGDDVQLITEADSGYVLKFRAVELWERLRQWLGK